MAKSNPSHPPERYEDIVKRLDEVVKLLESGELPLEDSLKAFEEGVGLVRRGEAKLNEAERRVELLLSEGGDKGSAADKRVPFDPEKPRSDGAPTLERKAARPVVPADDDITF